MHAHPRALLASLPARSSRKRNISLCSSPRKSFFTSTFIWDFRSHDLRKQDRVPLISTCIANNSHNQQNRTPSLHLSTSSKKNLISIINDDNEPNIDIVRSIPLCDVRNFCFIAHVDHGKSSLASRVLELTGNLGSETRQKALDGAAAATPSGKQGETDNQPQKKEQIELLDTLAVERDRGITVKATTSSMLYRHPSSTNPTGHLLLNMIDTPGHADFGLEVTKSLSNGGVDGAVLLFDSVKGVQAQTLSVYDKAVGEGVVVVPAVTKVLDKVCSEIPPPKPLPDDDGATLRARVVDSWFEPLRGVICLVQVLSGSLQENERISVLDPFQPNNDNNDISHYSVQEVGWVVPKRVRTGSLQCGQMGYVIAGLRDPRQAQSGMIMVCHRDYPRVTSMITPGKVQGGETKKLSPNSVLYASVHPMDGDGFDELAAAVDRLALNDTGLEVQQTSGLSSEEGSASGGPFLGPGLRIGFQGLLHVEVFRQRLLDEFNLEAIVTPPKVAYKIILQQSKRHKLSSSTPSEQIVEDLSQWPRHGEAKFKIEEPIVLVRIMSPAEYAGSIMELIQRKRGFDMTTKPIDEQTWLFESKMPWGEVVTDFHDCLKTVSAGYASFDTEFLGDEDGGEYREANVCKVDIMLNGDIVSPLAFVSHRSVVQTESRKVCVQLRDVLPRQQFVIVIQAKADGKIVASERIRAYRKDVLTTGGSKSVGGGDVTRKKKLLEKQKRGKKRQQASGKVTLSQEAFNSVISRS